MVARLSIGGTPTVPMRAAAVPENSNPGSAPATMPSVAQQYRMEISGQDLAQGHGIERTPPLGRTNLNQPLSPALHVNPDKAAFKRSSHSGPSSEHDLVKELEETDLSTFPALKHAFELLAAGYRSQRANHEADEMRWAMEVQELQSGEAHLLEAIQAVRDALESETRAHDMDLKTLNALVKKNVELEETVNRLKMLLNDKHTDRVLADSRPISHMRDITGKYHRSFTEGKTNAPLPIDVDHDSTVHSNEESHGLKSALRKHHHGTEHHMRDRSADHVFGHQRYCPETDSYRLVTSENSPQLSAEQLRQQHEALSKKVADLSSAFHELAEENSRLREICNPDALEAGLAQGHIAAQPVSYDISGFNSPPRASATSVSNDAEAVNTFKTGSHAAQQCSLAIRDGTLSPENHQRRDSNDPSHAGPPRTGETVRSGRNSRS